MFSELGDLLELRRRAISPQLLAAIQCVRRWQKLGYGPGLNARSTLTEDDLDRLYSLCEWDQDPI
jgi:hypothetical protein